LKTGGNPSSDIADRRTVISGAAFIIFFRIYGIDPLLTILISPHILEETYQIVKESVEIMMMTTPDGIALDESPNIRLAKVN